MIASPSLRRAIFIANGRSGCAATQPRAEAVSAIVIHAYGELAHHRRCASGGHLQLVPDEVTEQHASSDGLVDFVNDGAPEVERSCRNSEDLRAGKSVSASEGDLRLKELVTCQIGPAARRNQLRSI
jgi:hypothetical protein